MNSARDPIAVLQSEFLKRTRKNARYSVRSFAQSLGLSPATVSLLLRRKHHVTLPILNQLAEKLQFSPATYESLKLFLERQSHLTSRRKEVKGRRELQASSISQEIFEVVSDWRSLALFSLLELEDACEDPKWIAERLGLKATDVSALIDRLLSLSMLKREDGRLKQAIPSIRLDDRSSTVASRKIQRQFLTKAIEAISDVQPEWRDLTTMTFTMRKEDVAYAMERITRFRRQLTEELESVQGTDEVYNLSIQLYPLTTEKK
jgi:uncharacterized protein (TIGR02147 family)